jgi:8-oxo-dGTP diphosphatase
MSYSYSYPRPSVTVDILMMHPAESGWEVLLIERLHDPFQGMWALPGGFIEMDEDLHQSARRELLEETGLDIEKLQQFKAYGKPGRDPRGRTISVVFYAIISKEAKEQTKAGDDAKNAQWFHIQQLPNLAFDHEDIMQDAKSCFSFLH